MTTRFRLTKKEKEDLYILLSSFNSKDFDGDKDDTYIKIEEKLGKTLGY